jgi:integrase
VRRDLALLKAVLSKAVAWGVLEESPLGRLRLQRRASPPPRLPSAEEIARVLEALSPKMRRFCVFLMATGLRRREAMTLTWEDVDWSRREIRVRAESAKNRQPRVIPLSATAMSVLADLWSPGATGTIFASLTERGARAALERAFRRAGVEKPRGATFHIFRHWFTSALLESGASVNTVRELRGDRSLHVIERYMHALDGKKREAVERLLLNGSPIAC